MDSRRLDGHQGVQRLDGAFYREDHEVQIMFKNGTQRMDQVEDWSGTNVPQEEDSSQLEWCSTLDNHNTLIGRTMDNDHNREGVVTLLLGPTLMIRVAEYIKWILFMALISWQMMMGTESEMFGRMGNG